MSEIVSGFLYLYDGMTFFQRFIVVSAIIGLIILSVLALIFIIQAIVPSFKWRTILYAEKASTSFGRYNDSFYDKYYNKPLWADRDLYDQTCLSRTKMN